MINEREYQYRSFLAVLGTIILVLLIVGFLAFHGKYAEALGVGGVLTGLVGIGTLLARPSVGGNSAQSDANVAALVDKLPPATPTNASAALQPEGKTDA